MVKFYIMFFLFYLTKPPCVFVVPPTFCAGPDHFSLVKIPIRC